MPLAGIVVVLTLVELHAPHGPAVFVNPAEVTSMREPHYASQGWVAGSHCLLMMATGNQIAVTERCDEVRRKLEER